MSFRLCTYRQISPRKSRLIEDRQGLSAAQLGGMIAHAIDNTDEFIVYDQRVGSIIMRYKRKGMR